jgi:SAM-dependent methyltransferase
MTGAAWPQAGWLHVSNGKEMNRFLKDLVPASAKPLLRAVADPVRGNLEFIVQDFSDKLNRKSAEYMPFILPPARLRFQTHVSSDPDTYVQTALANAGILCDTLKRHGYALGDFKTVLDWGCGSGKELQALWLHHLNHAGSSMPLLFGTDISRDAIAWASKRIHYATFSLNDPDPPLPFQEGRFDFVYGISVFSHLDESHESAWLVELNRILKPGGMLIVSLRGTKLGQERMGRSVEDQLRLARQGMVFCPPSTGYRKEGLPDCYGNAYHTGEYVRAKYSRNFTLLELVEQGLRGLQDLVVLRKERRNAPLRTESTVESPDAGNSEAHERNIGVRHPLNLL